jgi:hypothetical protein
MLLMLCCTSIPSVICLTACRNAAVLILIFMYIFVYLSSKLLKLFLQYIGVVHVWCRCVTLLSLFTLSSLGSYGVLFSVIVLFDPAMFHSFLSSHSLIWFWSVIIDFVVYQVATVYLGMTRWNAGGWEGRGRRRGIGSGSVEREDGMIWVYRV